MKLDSKHIDLLITRYLSGEASADETLQLEKWMDESKANKKYFEGIRFAHDKAVASQPVIKFDADAAWDKLHKKMAALPAKPKEKVITIKVNTIYRLAVAASIALIIGLSYYFYQNANTVLTKSENYISETTTDSVKTIALSDSSKITINKDGKVEYAKDFGKKNREVKLTGEAYFSVTHMREKPFIVKVENTFVEDVGTAFNVDANPDSAFIEVFVDSGEVRFYSPTNPGLTLKQGETAIYNKSTDMFKKTVSIDENKLSYQSRIFHFNNTRLADVVKKINEVYPQQIKLSSKQIENCPITVVFNKENFETIVKIIAETHGLKPIRQNYGYLLDGAGCNEK